MAADSIQSGDVVVMLLGGDLPFVLRKPPDSEQHKLVADCYLHDFMCGSALLDAQSVADPTWLDDTDAELVASQSKALLESTTVSFPLTEFHLCQ